jgi:hypothetical protein
VLPTGHPAGYVLARNDSAANGEDMTTKRMAAWLLIAAAALLAAGAAAATALGARVSVRFTQDELQARIDQKLAKRNTFRGVTVESARVTLSDAFVIAVAMRSAKGPKRVTLVATAVGQPVYHPDETVFYFNPTAVEIEQLAFDGASLPEIAGRAADRFVRSERLKQAIVGRAEKAESWVKELAGAAIAEVLDRVPYKPKDTPTGTIIKTVLDSVAVDNGVLVVTLRVWRIAWWGLAASVVPLVLGLLLLVRSRPA